LRRRNREALADINVTNLVDITFTLLIVFMITAPMLSQGIKVQPPRVKAEGISIENTVKITITREHKIYINEQRVMLQGLAKYYETVFASKTNQPVVIYADEKVDYGYVIKVIAELKELGVEKLGFLTKPPQNEK